MLIPILYLVGFAATLFIFTRLALEWARADVGELSRYDHSEILVFSTLIAVLWPIMAFMVVVHMIRRIVLARL